MHLTAPYTLYHRTLPSGQKAWYYRVRLPDGSRSAGRSTGETSKVRAENLVREMWKGGKLLPERTPTLAAYTEKWFLWDECPYLKSKLKAGGTHTRSHADNQRRWLTKFIWPKLGDKRIDAISPKDCELWLDWLVKEKNAAVNSVRNYGKTLSMILSEAARLRDISENPMKAVRLPVRPRTEKGIPTESETTKLLSRGAWPDDEHFGNLYQVFNLVAHGTGLRLAEIQALRLCDIKEDHLHVQHSWSRKYGLGPTKGKKERYVPLSPTLCRRLLALKLELGIQDSGFLFSLNGGDSPIWNTSVVKHLQNAYRNIGIDRETQKQRKLSFHSWRHKFITDARGNVKEDELLKIVGHEKPETTDGYDHRRITKNQFMSKRQEGVV